MAYETLDEVRFHTQVIGHGPPLICTHGLFFGNLAGWMFGAGGQLARHHQVHLFDLRGHGRSSRPHTGYDLPQMTSDLERLLDRWGLGHSEEIRLAEHSFGALISLQLALLRPVEKLVLVEPPMPPTPVVTFSEFLETDPEVLVAALPQPLRESAHRGGRRARRLVDTLLGLVTETTLRDDVQQPLPWTVQELREMVTPTLIVAGKSSPCLSGCLKLADLLPNATCMELEGGHFLTVEAPGALAAAMEDFLG